MPGKKKGKSAVSALRPSPVHQDSLRRDIEAAQKQNATSPFSDDQAVDADDDDIANQLLATLDARDRAASRVTTASMEEERAELAESKQHQHLRVGSNQSGATTDSPKLSSSPLKQAGEKIIQAGEKLFGHHDTQRSPSATSPTLSPSSTSNADGELASEMQRRGSIRRLFGGGGGRGSPPSKALEGSAISESTSGGGGGGFDGGEGAKVGGRKKISRQKARLERKAAEMDAQRQQAEAELKANGGKPDEAERERTAIKELCGALSVEMKEINPDGHCLYAAVADQLNVLGKLPGSKLTYTETRKATAEYMRTHADDFRPFISDSDEHMAGIDNREAGQQSASESQQERYYQGYCDAVEKTAVWGGQPEILALSRAFHTPIHVVQAGQPVVKVGSDEGGADRDPVVISYHRHMYGLGEHYNSLHKL